MSDNSPFLEALVSGDAQIIKGIYDRNLSKVVSFVIKNKGNREDALDIFQKALMQLSVRYQREKFTIHSQFDAYLYTVCKNLWRRELNRSKIRVTNEGFREPMDEAKDIALSVLEQQRWELFQKALGQLSDNCRQVLALFFKKVSYAKMVEQLGYNSESVARQRVFKCKQKLISLVKKDASFKSLLEL